MSSASTKRLRTSQVSKFSMEATVYAATSTAAGDDEIFIKKMRLELKEKLRREALPTPPSSQEDIESLIPEFADSSISKSPLGAIPADEKRLGNANFPLYIVQSIMAEKDVVLLTLVSAHTGQLKTCTLRGSWRDSVISEGDKVMVVGTFDASDNCVMDFEHGLLITHPETLISPTLIGSAGYCTRKALLQNTAQSDTTMDMFIGTLVHDLMQRITVAVAGVAGGTTCSSKGSVEKSSDILTSLLRNPRYRQDMYTLQVDEDKVFETASSFIPNIEAWAWRELSKPNQRVTDIEEWIWSPRYGVKGRVDMTLTVDKEIVPLEIKTGKASFGVSHTGQVLLYTLLLSEKYNKPIKEGILYYAKTGEFKRVTAQYGDLAALIRLRNDLSHYLTKPRVVDGRPYLNLPSPLNNSRTCGNCPLNTTCSLFYKTVEEKRGIRLMPERHYVHQLVESKTDYLQKSHLEYFEKWMIWMYTEIHYTQSRHSVLDLWLKHDTDVNDQKSNGIGNLRLVHAEPSSTGQLIYTLERSSETSSALSAGDLVLLREDSDRGLVWDLCTVKSISMSPVVRIKLHADRFFENVTLKTQLLRIDKYIYSASAMSSAFDGLSRLMEYDETSNRLRSLILDHVAPRMNDGFDPVLIKQCKPILKSCSKSHQTAALKCMSFLDYLVVDCHTSSSEDSIRLASILLRVLHLSQLSVLLVCSNGSTLDSVLLEVRSSDCTASLLRLGPVARVNSQLHDLCAETIATDASFAEMKLRFRCAQIVATTSGSHWQPALSNRKFDVCLVMEASFILQPAVLGFLMLAEKYVFMGDAAKHYLPKNVEIDVGMRESIMEALRMPAEKAEAWITL